jgi:ABC-2 type transport system permease protein
VIGTGLYLTIVALIGIALGFIIRSTAGGIAALVAILLVLPGVVSILPETWQANISPYLPSNAGAALYDLHPDSTSLAPWNGFAVFCLYAAAALVAAAIVLKRRDA